MRELALVEIEVAAVRVAGHVGWAEVMDVGVSELPLAREPVRLRPDVLALPGIVVVARVEHGLRLPGGSWATATLAAIQRVTGLPPWANVLDKISFSSLRRAGPPAAPAVPSTPSTTTCSAIGCDASGDAASDTS
jgi:hypothetical protein